MVYISKCEAEKILECKECCLFFDCRMRKIDLESCLRQQGIITTVLSHTMRY